MGNTQFLKADFTPYGSHSLAEQVSDAADLVQAAFAGVGPNKSQATDGIHSFIRSCMHSVVRSFFRSFVRSFTILFRMPLCHAPQ